MTERKLEKEKYNSIVSLINQCKKGLMALHNSNGLWIWILFYFQSLNLPLLHACFWSALYAVLSRKMEIVSRVEWFDCVIANILEDIGLCIALQSLTPCVYALFNLVFLWKIDFKSVYGSSGTKIEISWEHAAYLHFVLWRLWSRSWLFN